MYKTIRAFMFILFLKITGGRIVVNINCDFFIDAAEFLPQTSSVTVLTSHPHS
jgi:hypothetical protein